MPLSLRRTSDVIETVNCLLSLLLTSILTWLVHKHSQREATTAYRRILLFICAMYYLNASILAVKVQQQIEPLEGRTYFTLGGWWRWEEPWNSTAIAWVTWVTLVYYLVLPLQSTYRYLVICK